VRSIATVLVLALILIVCGGLVFPAVQKVRAAAARMSCTNNLKQLSLALNNYHDTYNSFPLAALPNPALALQERLSWQVSLVPFIEAGNLYSRMHKEKGWDARENRFAAELDYRVLQCPAQARGPRTGTLVPTHYIGIAGLGPDAAELPAKDARAGFFGYERALALTDIKDHAGALLAAVETAQVSGAWTAAGLPTSRGLDADDPPYVGPDGQFGGTHPGGANALFADGSVRFLARSFDPEVFEAAATLRGAATLGEIGDPD
jgi:prepilin-type processing-associated H-X9-DG protein